MTELHEKSLLQSANGIYEASQASGRIKHTPLSHQEAAFEALERRFETIEARLKRLELNILYIEE